MVGDRFIRSPTHHRRLGFVASEGEHFGPVHSGRGAQPVDHGRSAAVAYTGLGLDQTAPQPSVIRMNASTTAPLLVTVLDLVHK